VHFMPDTEDADSAAERFWPEGYKQVIRGELRGLIGARLNGGRRLRHVYQRFTEKYADPEQFGSRIADMLAIGAENGADDAFSDIISAFLTESPLPEVRRHARYLWPQLFPQQAKDSLRRVIVEEYGQDDIYKYAYGVGYRKTYGTFDEFLNQVAELVITGTMNGTDDMLEGLYRSFLASRPLPQARRYPRRLKTG